jgi:hypothetical protein
MDPTVVISIIVSLGSLIVAGATMLTSASKGRVESLCQIVETQAGYIERLENQTQIQDVRIESLEADLAKATSKMVVLETENRCYLRILTAEGIDPTEYEVTREGANGRRPAG